MAVVYFGVITKPVYTSRKRWKEEIVK